MSDAERAYRATQKEIARLKKAKGDELRLSGKAFSALDRLPPELAELTNLQTLDLDGTQVSDISPLQTLTNLKALSLNSTKASDLRPIAGLEQFEPNYFVTQDGEQLLTEDGEAVVVLEDTPNVKLYFRDTPATMVDTRLADLAQIEDDQERTRKTLDYLRSLPPWPEPYTPAATPPQPIGAEPERPTVKASKAHIRHLLQNPMVTRLTAKQFAGQIKDALTGLPATNGNYLVEPLQTMLEFAEALEGLAPESGSATDPLDRAKLELRIAQLEAIVTRLGQQLQDETKAREAAEALAGKGLFGRSFKGEAGRQTAQLVFWVPKIVVGVGVYQAATHFLGVGNPVLEVFSRFLGKALN